MIKYRSILLLLSFLLSCISPLHAQTTQSGRGYFQVVEVAYRNGPLAKGQADNESTISRLAKMDSAQAIKQLTEVILREPSNATALANRGLLNRLSGKNEAAKKDCEAAIALVPEHSIALETLGALAYVQGDYSEAIEFFSRAVEKAEQYEFLPFAYPYFGRAMSWMKIGELDKAISDLDSTVKRYPFAMAFDIRGSLWHRKRNFEKAIVDYTEAIRIDPELYLPFYGRADSLMSQNQAQAALQDYDQALKLEPAFVDAYLHRARCKLALSQIDSAIDDYGQAIRLQPNNSSIYYSRGVELYKSNRKDGAMKDFDRAIELRPKFVNALLYKGRILSDIGRLAEARRAFELASQVQPTALGYDYLGYVLFHEEDYSRAFKAYGKASELSPSEPSYFISRGSCLVKLGEFGRAIQELDRAIQLNPRSALAYSYRGNARLKSGQFDSALADENQALSIDSDLATAYSVRGELHATMGNHDLAIADLNKAVQLEPDAAKHYQLRSESYVALGNDALAKKDSSKARELKNSKSAAQTTVQETKVGLLSEIRNVSYSSGSSLFPVIAAGPNDSIHAVWMDNSSGNFEILYSMWDGLIWSSNQNLSHNASNSMYPTIAVDRSGRIHAAWMDGELGKETNIFHSQTADSGWTDPLDVSRASGISQRPKLAVDSTGTVHLAWFGNQGSFFELYHAQLVDAEWMSPNNPRLVDWYINVDPEANRAPGFAAGDGGHLYLVWEGMEDDPSEYSLTQNVRLSRWNGNAWSRPEIVSRYSDMSANVEDPFIAVDSANHLHVVWENSGATFYAHFDRDHWSQPRQLGQATIKTALPTVIAGAVQIHFAWLGTNESETQIYYRQSKPEGWSEPIKVSQSSDTAVGCRMAEDTSGTIHLIWMDNRAGDFEVLHRMLTK